MLDLWCVACSISNPLYTATFVLKTFYFSVGSSSFGRGTCNRWCKSLLVAVQGISQYAVAIHWKLGTTKILTVWFCVSTIEIHCQLIKTFSDGLMRMQHIRKWCRKWTFVVIITPVCRAHQGQVWSGRLFSCYRSKSQFEHTNSIIMRKCKWLYVNCCECLNPVSTMMGFQTCAILAQIHYCAEQLCWEVE